jgi:hypothetical protein
MKEPVVVIVVGLFILAMVVRLIQGFRLGRRFSDRTPKLPECADSELTALVEDAKKTGKVREAIRNLGSRASMIDSAALRAAYRCAAGNLALTELKRPALSVGMYLRALREDPTCIEALDKVQEILVTQKHLRRLERTYWDVLGRLDDAEAGGDMWIKCWSGLASLYSASSKNVRRADAIRKALAAYVPDACDTQASQNDPPNISPISNATKPM